MFAALTRSLRLHGTWIGQALRPGQSAAPLTPRRVATLALGLPPYLTLQSLHWLGFALDEVLYPGYRRQRIEAPLFILGVPRSGTTFVHRTLAADPDRCTMRTWEALLAPSVSERKAWRALIAADARLGGWGRRGIDALSRRLLGQLDAIHETALEAAEEDYLALLPAGACFILALTFPHSAALWRLAALDRMGTAERELIVGFYRRMLQKQLYADGGQRRLLSKNAAFATWVEALAEAFPDARFLLCIREPEAALSSQLSAVAPGHSLLGTRPDRLYPEHFRRAYEQGYAHLRQAQRRYPERVRVLDMATLKQHAGSTLERLLAELGLPAGPELQAALAAAESASRRYRSAHRHRPEHLDSPQMQADYECLLAQEGERLREAS